MAPCDGLRVLDLGQAYGALPGMVLADYGAEVVKLEPPGGDKWRTMPGFLQWNRGKRGVVADLKNHSDVQAVLALAAECDVLIESFRPGVADRLGIGWADLSAVNPGLVYLSITGFGPRGFYTDCPAYEGVVAAVCGQFMIQNGYRETGPIYDAVPKCSFGAAMLGLIGVLAALRVRARSGVGQRVDSTLLQSNFVYSYTGIRGESDEITRALASQVQGRDPHNVMPGYRIAECADGQWIQSGSASGRIFENLMKALQIDEYFHDPVLSKGPGGLSPEDNTRLLKLIDDAYRRKPLAEWVRILGENDAAYGIFDTTQGFMDYPQVVHNRDVIEIEDPSVGSCRQVGQLVKFASSGTWKPRPAPAVGADQALLESGWSARAEGERGREPLPDGPLQGVTILDLSMFAAAPGGPGLLADLGARVIKVEPLAGDPLGGEPLGGNELFFRVNRGKERVAVDLKSDAGQEILRSLVGRTDVVVHNYRPGVPERLGLGFDTVVKLNPKIVYVYGSSFGSTGPDSHRPAFDAVISAMAGGEMLQAGRGNPPQQRQTSDHSALLGVAVAILLGLRARDLTGEAQALETTMLASAAYLFSDDFIRYEGKPPRPVPDPGQYGLHALYRLYETAEGWVFLACCQESEWTALCHALGTTDWLTDGRFSSAAVRQRHDEELSRALAAVLRSAPAAQWEESLLGRGVACVVADRQWPELLFDSNLIDIAGLTTEYELPKAGRVQQTGRNVSLGATPGRVGRPESLGASTARVLIELGYSPEDVSALEAAGVVRLDA